MPPGDGTIRGMSTTTAAEVRPEPAQPGRRYAGRTAVERRAERRRRLLEAGHELFGTAGYPATSIEELCAAAAISTRTFYEEVDGREELLLLLHAEVLRGAEAAVLRALSSAPLDDATARARAAMRAFVDFMTADPRNARLAYVEVVGVSPAVERQRHAWMEHFAALVQAEAAHLAGLGLVPRRDFELTGMAVVGAIDHLVVHWAAAHRRPSRERLVGEMVRFVVAALSAP